MFNQQKNSSRGIVTIDAHLIPDSFCITSCYSIFNIRELLLGHIILQGTYTQDGLIERPLLLPFVKKKCCT